MSKYNYILLLPIAICILALNEPAFSKKIKLQPQPIKLKLIQLASNKTDSDGFTAIDKHIFGLNIIRGKFLAINSGVINYSNIISTKNLEGVAWMIHLDTKIDFIRLKESIKSTSSPSILHTNEKVHTIHKKKNMQMIYDEVDVSQLKTGEYAYELTYKNSVIYQVVFMLNSP